MLGLLASETEGFARLTDELSALVRAGGDLQVVLNYLAKSAPANAPAPVPAAAAAVAAVPEIPASALRPVEEKKVEKRADALAASKEDDSCAICMAAKSTTALVECGHLLCGECAGPLVGRQCPICRQPVLRLLKIFKV